MKVETYTEKQENTILTAMIVSSDALAAIAGFWTKEGFESELSKIVGPWCIDYFEKYGKAPGKEIEVLFVKWAETQGSKETIQLVEAYLQSLSADYEQLKQDINPIHIRDLARDHFEKTEIKRIHHTVESGDFVKAREKILSFSPSEDNEFPIVDVFQDMDAIRKACSTAKEEPLITYPEGLGDFYGDSLRRGAFVAFLGSDKSGKSYLLHDMALRGVFQRRKVLYFEAGDLSQDQLLERFMVRLTGKPRHPCIVHYPTDIIKEGDEYIVTSDERIYENPFTFRDAMKACYETQETKVRDIESYFKIRCFPNSMLRTSEIRSTIKKLKRSDWAVDVVIVDYADILCPHPKAKDEREASNHNWKHLAAIRQEFNCLVVTATQANADAYKAEIMTKRNFSEDKRKNAHVTGIVGISATPEEREKGLRRLNWVTRRDAYYNEKKCCYVAGCLELGSPCIKSVF